MTQIYKINKDRMKKKEEFGKYQEWKRKKLESKKNKKTKTLGKYWKWKKKRVWKYQEQKEKKSCEVWRTQKNVGKCQGQNKKSWEAWPPPLKKKRDILRRY